MAYGFEVLTSDGYKQVTSISDLGLRLAAAYTVDGAPSNPTYAGYAPNSSNTLTPTVSGTINGPSDYDINNNGFIFCFMDIGQTFYFQNYQGNTEWLGAGTWLHSLNLSWDNTTKVLSYNSNRVDVDGVPTRPYTGKWNIWLMYGA